MNKKYINLFFILAFCTDLNAKPAKIVGLVPGRNESIYLKQFFKALSLFTDAIVYLDDASTDESVKIAESMAKECKIEKIITKKKWVRDEPGDRNAMLKAGRSIGGTHFIVIDADEMLTSNWLKNKLLRKKILELQPGDQIFLTWIQLWRDVNNYRFDDSVWTNNMKSFIFCDDGKCRYRSQFIHTSRTPKNLKGKIHRIEGYEYGMLHFQFVNWRNLLVKQAWYRCLERIRTPEKSCAAINKIYAPSKDETNLHVESSPKDWFKMYNFIDFSVFQKTEKWRETQVINWLEQYGNDYFCNLDIWDIDWGKGLETNV